MLKVLETCKSIEDVEKVSVRLGLDPNDKAIETRRAQLQVE